MKYIPTGEITRGTDLLTRYLALKQLLDEFGVPTRYYVAPTSTKPLGARYEALSALLDDLLPPFTFVGQRDGALGIWPDHEALDEAIEQDDVIAIDNDQYPVQDARYIYRTDNQTLHEPDGSLIW